MNEQFSSTGRILIVAGVVFILAGILLTQFNKIPFFGKLPGDIFIRKGNFTFYFPVVTSIVVSLLLTLIFYLVNKFKQ